jgi:hypothetical protein
MKSIEITLICPIAWLFSNIFQDFQFNIPGNPSTNINGYPITFHRWFLNERKIPTSEATISKIGLPA